MLGYTVFLSVIITNYWWCHCLRCLWFDSISIILVVAAHWAVRSTLSVRHIQNRVFIYYLSNCSAVLVFQSVLVMEHYWRVNAASKDRLKCMRDRVWLYVLPANGGELQWVIWQQLTHTHTHTIGFVCLVQLCSGCHSPSVTVRGCVFGSQAE